MKIPNESRLQTMYSMFLVAPLCPVTKSSWDFLPPSRVSKEPNVKGCPKLAVDPSSTFKVSRYRALYYYWHVVVWPLVVPLETPNHVL